MQYVTSWNNDHAWRQYIVFTISTGVHVALEGIQLPIPAEYVGTYQAVHQFKKKPQKLIVYFFVTHFTYIGSLQYQHG